MAESSESLRMGDRGIKRSHIDGSHDYGFIGGEGNGIELIYYFIQSHSALSANIQINSESRKERDRNI